MRTYLRSKKIPSGGRTRRYWYLVVIESGRRREHYIGKPPVPKERLVRLSEESGIPLEQLMRRLEERGLVRGRGEQPLRIHLLGKFRLRMDGPVDIRGEKAKLLLAYLVTNPEKHPRKSLARRIWAGKEPQKALNSLNQALHMIRSSIGRWHILSGEGKIWFNPKAGYWLDVEEFEKRLNRGEFEDLEVARCLYRGEFLEGFESLEGVGEEILEWIREKRSRLRQGLFEALEKLAEHYEALEWYGKAAEVQEQLLGLEREEGKESSKRLRTLVSLLIRSLGDPTFCKRWEATDKLLRYLEEMGIDEGVLDELEEGLKDPNPDKRWHIIHVLRGMAEKGMLTDGSLERALKALKQRVLEEEDLDVKGKAAISLIEILGIKRAKEELEELIEEADLKSLRMIASAVRKGMAGQDPASAVGLLRELIKRAKGRAEGEGFEAQRFALVEAFLGLREAVKKDPGVLSLEEVKGLIEGAEEHLKGVAILILNEKARHDPKAPEILEELISGDEPVNVKIDATIGLGKAAESSPERALPQLKRLANSDDPLLSMAARFALVGEATEIGRTFPPINRDNFSKVIASNERVGIICWSEYCNVSRISWQALSKLADKYREEGWRFFSLDVDKNKQLREELRIECTPTVLFYEKGSEKMRIKGGPDLINHVARSGLSEKGRR